MEAIISLLIMLAIFGGYLLPSLVARARRHRNVNAITVLNLFLGWTVLGWLVALIWASTDNTTR